MQAVVGGQQPARRAPRRRSNCCIRLFCPSPATLRLGVALLVAVGAVAYGNNRLLASFATLSEAAGEVVVAGANVTTAFTTFTVRALATIGSTADDFWRGVDLLDVSIHRSTAKMVGRSADHLVPWLEKKHEYPLSAREWYIQQVRSVDFGVPALQANDEMLHANGSYLQTFIHVRLRGDSSVVVAIVLQVAEYDAQWSNVGWELLGFHTQSEVEQIVGRLRNTLNKWGNVPTELLAIDDAAILQEFDMPVGWSAWLPNTRQLVWYPALASLLLATGLLVALAVGFAFALRVLEYLSGACAVVGRRASSAFARAAAALRSAVRPASSGAQILVPQPDEVAGGVAGAAINELHVTS